MPDNIDRYVPEFDEEESRERLSAFDNRDLTDMLIRAYKEKRILAKLLDEQHKKIDRIETILREPSNLPGMPDIPGPDDLKRMTEGE